MRRLNVWMNGALVGELTEQDLMVRESGFDAGPYVMFLDAVIYLRNPLEWDRQVHQVLGSTVAEVMRAKPHTCSGDTTLPAAARVRVEAPLDAGFLRVRQGETDLLAASVHFADTREADFAACAPADTLDEGNAAAVERHTEEDHWWRAWVLLLLLALLISWHFTRERESAKSQTPAIKPQEATP